MLALPYRNSSPQQAARAIGLSAGSVYEAIRRGCPYVSRRNRRGDISSTCKLVDPNEIRLYLGSRYKQLRKHLPGVSEAELCDALSITHTGVGRYIAKGMPVIRSQFKRFDIEACRSWLAENTGKPQKRIWIKGGIDNRSGFIYGIFEPKAKNPRYIGKTDDCQRRWGDHCRSWRGKHKGNRRNRLENWLHSLYRRGLEPEFRILQECLPGMMNAAEQEWIAKGRDKRWNLVNDRAGGESGALSESTRRWLSEHSKRKWQDPAYRARVEAAIVRRNEEKTKGNSPDQHGDVRDAEAQGSAIQDQIG